MDAPPDNVDSMVGKAGTLDADAPQDPTAKTTLDDANDNDDAMVAEEHMGRTRQRYLR